MKKKSLWLTMAAAACAAIMSGCFATGPRTSTTCDGTADAFSCTDDLCPSTGGAIVHVPVHARCGADRWCDPANPAHDSNGCVGTPPVGCGGDCADAFTCTLDFCDAGSCRHVPDSTECPGDGICRATSADGSSGCFTPPVECSSGCDDGVACTVDSCSGGSCRHFADDTACSASQRCDAARGCVDRTPPTGTFTCAPIDGASRIGRTVRLCARGMTGIRTVPNRAGETMAMTNSSMRTWLDEGDVPAGGCRDYDLTGLTGGINTHPFIGEWRVARSGHPEWDLDILNVADFRSHVGRSAASVGIEAYVCQRAAGCTDSQLVELPEEFYVLAPDTVDMRYWSADPNLHPDITGEIAIRAVLNPGCDETGAHPADL